MLYLYQNGTLTPITPVKEANNLRFELPAGFSASDAVLGWTKYVAPDTEEESAFDRAQDRFWGDVLRAIAFSDAGAVLTVDAGYFDKMPVEIMNAVNVRDVTLVIRWNHGDDIVISRANALTPEISRIYYPPVSYTHLDVYKRQILPCMRSIAMLRLRMPKTIRMPGTLMV